MQNFKDKLFDFVGFEQHWIPQVKVVFVPHFKILVYFVKVWIIEREPSYQSILGAR